MTAKEKWREVAEYEGIYEVSNMGRIKSIYRRGSWKVEGSEFPDGRIIKTGTSSHGYPMFIACKNSKRKGLTVHRLVAKAFIKNEVEKLEVNHKDGNRENNKVDNLEWCTRQENIDHSYKHGLCKERDDSMRGEKGFHAKLRNKDIPFIRTNAKQNGGIYTQKQLGEKLDVSRSTIKNVLLGNTWTHV